MGRWRENGQRALIHHKSSLGSHLRRFQIAFEEHADGGGGLDFCQSYFGEKQDLEWLVSEQSDHAKGAQVHDQERFVQVSY